MDEKMTVLVVEPQKTPYVKEIGTGLEALQKAVGGYIQAIYPWNEPVALICGEESKINGEPLNRALRDEDGHIYDIVAGTFIITGLGKENFCSLNDEHIRKFMEQFRIPEMFMKIDGKLAVLPMKPPEEKRPSVLKQLKEPLKQESQEKTKNRSKNQER